MEVDRTPADSFPTRPTAVAAVALVVLAVLLTACGSADKPSGGSGSARGRGAGRDGRMESSSVAEGRATGSLAAVPPPDRTGAPKALFLGTSLTAGLGLPEPTTQSWPGVIQQLADSAGIPFFVVNAGLSGETSAGALRRADWVLKEKFDVVVVETGANDGLRGLNFDSTASNVRGIIRKARAANPGATIFLVQMEAPTNMGPRYNTSFHDLFPKVARETGVILLPFLLDGVGGIAKFNQDDGIHPTVEGARMVAHNVWPGIRAALRRR